MIDSFRSYFELYEERLQQPTEVQYGRFGDVLLAVVIATDDDEELKEFEWKKSGGSSYIPRVSRIIGVIQSRFESIPSRID